MCMLAWEAVNFEAVPISATEAYFDFIRDYLVNRNELLESDKSSSVHRVMHENGQVEDF